MRRSTLGLLCLVVMAVLVASLVLSFRRKPADEVITTGSARGQAGLAIHSWRGHRLTLGLGWAFAVGVTLLGVWYLQSSPYAAGLFVLAGLAMLYLAWSRATGRAGDGTLTLTPEGVHQLCAGSEVFVPWDDVRGLVTTPTDFILETTRPAVPVHPMVPFLGRRKVVRPDAVDRARAALAAHA